jgi:hypothetical protein
MKNIHVVPTPNKSSRLYKTIDNRLCLSFDRLFETKLLINHNIYITSDEEIKEGDYFYSPFQGEERILKYNKFVIPFPKDKKIILTTDQDLIKDGVQAIGDEFLEWFVKNPSCEEVEVQDWVNYYKIFLPKEEPKQDTVLLKPVGTKQETLEEVAEWVFEDIKDRSIFLRGAKFSREQTIEEVFEWLTTNNYATDLKETMIKDFNKFKNK